MEQTRAIVIGGGIIGCIAARAARKRGCAVTVVESRQSLGYELTATGRSRLESGKTEVALSLGALRKLLLAEEQKDGGGPLFTSYAGGILLSDEKTAGIIIANSYGTQMLPGETVIDTEGILSVEPFEGYRKVKVNYAFVMEQVKPPFFREALMEEGMGLYQNRIMLHMDLRPDCVTAEFAFEKEITYETLCSPQRLLPEAQRRAAEVFRRLKTGEPAFVNAGLQNGMYHEVWLSDIPERKQRRMPEGYFVVREELPERITTEALEQIKAYTEARVREICAESIPARPAISHLWIGGKKIPIEKCTVADMEEWEEDRGLKKISIPAEAVPCRQETAVLVAGSGTAGTQSAIALAEKEIPFVLIENNCMVGGTRNLGGVIGYWHGYQGGWNADFDRRAEKLAEEVAVCGDAFQNCAHILLQNSLLQRNEKNIWVQTTACGIFVQEERAASVLCCDRSGLFRVKAEIVIDATGDGSAAALAGAGYLYGDPRDGRSQSFSRWGENIWSEKSFLESRFRGDYDMADVESYGDYLRCIYLTQQENSDIDYSPMLTLRESRRIMGDYVLSMEDIWGEKAFEDTIAVAQAPFDTHGPGTGLFCGMGLCGNGGEELRARIPYRCYLVKGLKNMLVTGKAFSAARNASSVCRMNADLRHAGYAVGLAAALAVTEGQELRGISLEKVQKELLQKACLPEWTFDRKESVSGQQLFRKAERGEKNALRELFLTCGEESLEGITKAWKQAPENALLLQLAAWCGNREAVAEVVKQTKKMLVQAAQQGAGDAQGVGIYETACRNLAILQYSGQTSAEHLRELIGLADAGGEVAYTMTERYKNTIYGFDRVDGWRVPHFLLLYLLAGAVERHCDVSLAKPMEELLGKAHICGYITKGGITEASAVCHGMSPVFCAFLEIRLTAAASRCGSRNALLHLADFLEEDRSLLRRFAGKELEAVTGQNFGFDMGKWKKWIPECGELKAAPYTGEIRLC